MILSEAPGPISLKAKEDLSIFADSSVSFYEPGDTAADSDILPRAVLADDGSSTDAAESTQLHEAPNYADSHWYKAGQSQDVHGDLQEENRARENTERVKMVHQQQLHEREHEMWVKKEQQRAIEAEQAQLRQRRRAAVQELHDRRMERAHEEQQRGMRGRSAMPLSYKAMQNHMHAKDAAIHKKILRDSYAYQHPFASGKKGMQNLVMAEFKQDEHKMQATTEAIFGRKTAHTHQWRHGGLLLSDASHPDTLHDAMKRQRAHRKLEDRARQQLLAQEHPGAAGAQEEAKKAFKPHVVSVGCTIEQLENGGCSHHMKQPQAKQASLKSAAKPKGSKGADVVTPSAAPTAGTVISGWAHSVGGWF